MVVLLQVDLNNRVEIVIEGTHVKDRITIQTVPTSDEDIIKHNSGVYMFAFRSLFKHSLLTFPNRYTIRHCSNDVST